MFQVADNFVSRLPVDPIGKQAKTQGCRTNEGNFVRRACNQFCASCTCFLDCFEKRGEILKIGCADFCVPNDCICNYARQGGNCSMSHENFFSANRKCGPPMLFV